MNTPTGQISHVYSSNLLLLSSQQIAAQVYGEALYALETAVLVLKKWPDSNLQGKVDALRLRIPDDIQSTCDCCFAFPTETGLMCSCGAFAPYDCICVTPEHVLDADFSSGETWN